MSNGTLSDGEPHPAAISALKYVQSLGLLKLSLYSESFASCGLAGNRLADVCGETLRRVVNGEPVGDGYILGLAWELKNMEEAEG